MPHGSLRRLAPFAALVLIVVAGVVYLEVQSHAEGGALQASGTVSAVEVTVASELSGRVADVLVDEGDRVEAGQALFRLDGALLEAQRSRALAAQGLAEASLHTVEANLESVEAQYALALSAARRQALPSRLADWAGETPWQFSLPGWYFGQSEEIAAAEDELSAAEEAVAQAHADLEALVPAAQREALRAAEDRLAAAAATYQVARDVQARAAEARTTADLLEAADEQLEAARLELVEAQSEYDDLFDDAAASEMLQARADLALAQARLEAAADRLAGLQTGEDSLQVQAAAAQRSQASAAVEQARAAVAQAQAEVAALDVQIEKLVIYAPSAGVIITRSLEPGEVAVAGGAVMTIGQLDQLTITVYLPEDRYGEIHLGDGARVTVDSFPEIEFEAQVARIASQAEFTPRNVQTQEGRRTTVFAVELTLSDPLGRLKPGMPADVIFDDGN